MGAGENILEEEENEGCTGLRNMTEDDALMACGRVLHETTIDVFIRFPGLGVESQYGPGVAPFPGAYFRSLPLQSVGEDP